MAAPSKTKPLDGRFPTPAQIRRAFRPYGVKLGELVLFWNDLHHNLSVLFELVVKSPSRKMGMSIWYSTDSDYAQRKMLRAATETANQLTVEQRGDILWIIDKIDDSLRHHRNNALHSPLAFVHDVTQTPRIFVIPNFYTDSPRAKALLARGFDNFKVELEDYISLATVLSDFAEEIGRSVFAPAERPWPKRPLLPHAHRKKSPKEGPRQNTAK
jgi:hypothetical protein